MILTLTLSLLFFSLTKSLTNVKVISYGLLPIENINNSGFLEYDNLNSFNFGEFISNWTNFSVSFSGWIDTGPSIPILQYQSKIQIQNNTNPLSAKGMFFGNNKTHFIVREDISSTISKAECSLSYNFNQKYHYFISMKQRYNSISDTWLYFLFALRDENGAVTFCTSKETLKANIFNVSNSSLVYQVQKPADTYSQSTQMMGANTGIRNYFTNSTNTDLLRFLLNFGPNSYELFHFQFSYEFSYCDCLIDTSQNTLRGSSSLSSSDLISYGGAGYFIFGFTQNETISFNSGKLRFGSQTDTLYRDLNYTRLTTYYDTQSVSFSFWMNISSSVSSFTIFKYVTPQKTFQLSTSRGGGRKYFLLLQDGNSAVNLSSTIAPNFHHHYIIAISSQYLDFYVNGTFVSKKYSIWSTFFQGVIPQGKMYIGGSNIPISSIVLLSQFRVFSTNAVLGSFPYTTNIISNCQALIQNRTQTYSCLICQSGYFLKTLSSCVSTCGGGFKAISSVRMCIPQCPFGCETCDLTNPKKCLKCIANRVLRQDICECPTGTFEDFRMASCFTKKKLTNGFDTGMFEMNKVTSVIVQFVNPFPTPPQVIFSLLSFSYQISNEIKAFFISATSVSETEMEVSSNTDQLLFLHVQYFAYDSTNSQYMSRGLGYNLTTAVTAISQLIDKGTYYNTHAFRITPLFAGIGCQINTVIQYPNNRCIYQLDWDTNQITVNSSLYTRQVTFVYVYYLLSPVDPDINNVYLSRVYSNLFADENKGQNVLEKTSYLSGSRSISDPDLFSNNEIMLNLDTLTTLRRMNWDQDNFSYFRIAPTGYNFISNSTIIHTYELSIHSNAIYDTYLNNLMLYEKFNFFAFCQYVDFFTMKCLRCSNGFDPNSLCISCLHGQSLIGGECICGSGKWVDSFGVCKDCDPSCSSCSSQENCTTCKGQLIQATAQEGLCACSNPLKWFDALGSCSFCQSTCDTCISETSCLTCYPSMTQTSAGQCECPAEQWFQEITLNCQPCYFICSSCFNTNNQTSHNCLSCKGGRDLVNGSCVCNGSNDQSLYLDDLRCSKEQTAVLNSILTSDFLTLTIHFGTGIAFNPSFSSSSTTSCSNIFTSASMMLIGSDSICTLTANSLNIALGSMARVLNGDILSYNQNSIKFTYNGLYITEFVRSYVSQSNPVASSVSYYSPAVFNFCNAETIKIDTIQNDGGRGVSSILWSFVSMTPIDNDAYNSLLQSISDSNTLQSLKLILKMHMAKVDFQLKISLNWMLHVGLEGTNLFIADIKTRKSIQAHLSLSEPSPYFLYQNLIATISFQIWICTGNGGFVQQDDAVNVRLQNSVLSLDETQANISAREWSKEFPAFSLISNYLYQILVTVSLTSDPTNFTSEILGIECQLSELYVLIIGGNRYINFKKAFNVTSSLTDYEMNNSSHLPSGIAPLWACQDIEFASPCIDLFTQNSLDIPRNQNISFPGYQFSPFTAIKLILTGSKDHTTASGTTIRKKSNGIIIFVTEMDIPPLEIATDSKINVASTINLNQILHATINYDSKTNPNNLYYAGAILYNYEIVATMEFKFSFVRFQVWDYYQGFLRSNPNFEIRFSAYNPQFILPSLTTLSFSLNFPPKDCSLSIFADSTPTYSLETLVNIIMSNCVDDNTPLMYQFFYYDNLSDYEFEKQNPLKVQRKQLSEKISSSNLQTVLPPGNIWIIVQVFDSQDAISNCTQAFTTLPQQQSSSTYTIFVNNFISNTQSLIPGQQIINFNFLTSDLLNRGVTLMQSSNLNSIKLQIVNLVESVSNKLLSSSFLYQLGYQIIGQLLSSQINMNSSEQTTKLASLSDGLSAIEGKCQTSEQNQQQYQKCIENIYLTFNQVNGLSSNTASSSDSNASFIKLSESIGNLQNKFALPNENAVIHTGDNLHIKSQRVTKKLLQNYVGLSQLDSDTDIGTDTQIYDATIKIYNTNVYSNDPSFIEYKENLTKVLNTTQMTTVFPVINPTIKLISNSTLFNSTRGTVQFFQNKEPTRNLTCITKSLQKGSWVTSECTTKINVFKNEVQCLCTSLTPITVVEDISSLFTDNKNLNTVFSSGGISNLSNFTDFYRYIAFWILSSQTLALIIFIIKGRRLDQIQSKLLNRDGSEKEDKIKNEVKSIIQSKVSGKIHPISTLSLQLPIQSNLVVSQPKRNRKIVKPAKYDTIKSFGDSTAIPYDKNQTNYPKFDTHVLLGGSSQFYETPKSLIEKNTLINSKDLPANQESLQNVKILPQNDKVQSEFIEKNQQNENDIQITEESENEKNFSNEKNLNIVNKAASKLKSLQAVRERELQKANEITLEEKNKLNQIDSFFFFLHFHDFFSIFLVYLKDLSRQIRFILFYLRYTHTLAISIIFSSMATSLVQMIFISIFSSVVITIFSKIITSLLLKTGTFLSQIGAFFTFSVVTFYLYMILSVQSGQKYQDSNKFFLGYAQFLAMDVLIYQTITAFCLGLIAKTVLKISQNVRHSFFFRLFDLLKLHMIINSQILFS